MLYYIIQPKISITTLQLYFKNKLIFFFENQDVNTIVLIIHFFE